jgi:hypothetical protein
MQQLKHDRKMLDARYSGTGCIVSLHYADTLTHAVHQVIQWRESPEEKHLRKDI